MLWVRKLLGSRRSKLLWIDKKQLSHCNRYERNTNWLERQRVTSVLMQQNAKIFTRGEFSEGASVTPLSGGMVIDLFFFVQVNSKLCIVKILIDIFNMLFLICLFLFVHLVSCEIDGSFVVPNDTIQYFVPSRIFGAANHDLKYLTRICNKNGGIPANLDTEWRFKYAKTLLEKWTLLSKQPQLHQLTP